MIKKIFMSSDIEGTCGIAHWDETEKSKGDYATFSTQMSKEVAAACEGAMLGGAVDIFVRDSHDSARNIQPAMLPEDVRIFRGWGRDPYSMMSGIDESFGGVIFTGYHSAASWSGNPLSHTMNTQNVVIHINGIKTSEMVMNAFTAAYYDVPVLMITGDAGVCEAAKRLNPNIYTVPVQVGRGNGTISIHPDEAVRRIRETAEKAVREGIANPDKFKVELPNKFDVEVDFKHHSKARRASFYPGVRKVGDTKVMFSSDAYYDVLRFFMFCL